MPVFFNFIKLIKFVQFLGVLKNFLKLSVDKMHKSFVYTCLRIKTKFYYFNDRNPFLSHFMICKNFFFFSLLIDISLEFLIEQFFHKIKKSKHYVFCVNMFPFTLLFLYYFFYILSSYRILFFNCIKIFSCHIMKKKYVLHN